MANSSKAGLHAIGIDDGPVVKGAGRSVLVVGAVMAGPAQVEGFLTTALPVDGDDPDRTKPVATRDTGWSHILTTKAGFAPLGPRLRLGPAPRSRGRAARARRAGLRVARAVVDGESRGS